MDIVKVNITTEYIKADQFLKWVGIASMGSEAKAIISEGQVKLNDIFIKERGKKIKKGDKVEYNNIIYEIT